MRYTPRAQHAQGMVCILLYNNINMKLAQKAKYYGDFLEVKKREDGTKFVAMRDNPPQALHDAIYHAHGDSLPNDWTFETFLSLLENVENCDAENIDAMRDNGYTHEIIDGMVDIYTHDLLSWLSSSTDNLQYLAEASGGWSRDDGDWQLLARAQYQAIEEIAECVWDLLDSDIAE